MAWPGPMHTRETAPPARGAGRQCMHAKPLPAQIEVRPLPSAHLKLLRPISTCAVARLSTRPRVT
jgi:hypothetical protein